MFTPRKRPSKTKRHTGSKSKPEGSYARGRRGTGPVGHLLESKPSVEEYFEDGMADYYRQLAMEKAQARSAAERFKGPDNLPEWALLGDALDVQLRHMDLITRAVQTDWKWHKMAVRWRQARTIETSLPPPPRPMTVIEIDRTQLLHPSSKTSVHDASIHTSKSKHFHRRAAPSRMHLKLGLYGQPDDPVLQAQCGLNDKCLDTSDLAFDPYDSGLVYTPAMTHAQTFLSARLFMSLNRWKYNSRMRLATDPKKLAHCVGVKTKPPLLPPITQEKLNIAERLRPSALEDGADLSTIRENERQSQASGGAQGRDQIVVVEAPSQDAIGKEHRGAKRDESGLLEVSAQSEWQRFTSSGSI